MTSKRTTVIDVDTVPERTGSPYPASFAGDVAGRRKRALGDAAGLKNFGVNLVTLSPGNMSSQRHWHTRQDEFVWVIEGELVLVTNAGETVLRPGACAGFPAGVPDGHHLVNRSDADAVYLEIGDRAPGDETDYPDVDLLLRIVGGERRFVHKDGTPY